MEEAKLVHPFQGIKAKGNLKVLSPLISSKESGNIQEQKYELKNQLLHEIFEQQADLTPNARAIECGSFHLTYQELDQSVNQLCHLLLQRGVRKGSTLGILLDRSEWPVQAILAALKVGAAYIPIDPNYPVERIVHIAKQASLSLLLSECSLMEKARSSFSGPTLDLPAQSSLLKRMPTRRPDNTDLKTQPMDLAYIIYTSGSSGHPKGVMVEHRNVVRYVQAFNQICATGPQDRVFQGFSLVFDGSVEEIWMAFSNGSTLVIPEKSSPRFGNELGAYLSSMQITYFSTVPTMLSTITQKIPSLRTLVLRGESCPSELIQRWSRPELKIWNVYGPTEATVNTTAKECLPGERITVGRPLNGYELHILDEQKNPCLPGQKGELYIGGDTLARGYLGQNEKTEESFLHLQEGKRFYKTGDLMSWNENGELEFFGRIDSQVKIRGYRVELSEIESILLEHKNIRNSALTLHQVEGNHVLAAYVTLRDPHEKLERTELLNLLESRLPPYMIPSFLDVLEAFPLLASGKADRKQLPFPRFPLVREAKNFREPVGEMEIAIARAWKNVFQIEKISANAHFFRDLSGHSLSAAKTVTLLRSYGYPETQVRDIYSYPVLETLAAKIKAKRVPVQKTNSASSPDFHFSPFRYYLCGIAQFVSSIFLYGLYTTPFVLIFPRWLNWFYGETSFRSVMIPSLLIAASTWPALLVFSIIAKWLLLGEIKNEPFPLWGWKYFRFWLSEKISALAGRSILEGTPLLSLYLRAMGARIGANCILETAMIGVPDLLSIGANTSIGAGSQLLGFRVEGNTVRVGTIHIGERCYIGIHSCLGLNVRMENDSTLGDQSLLPDHQSIEKGSAMFGSPPIRQAFPLPVPSEKSVKSINGFCLGVSQILGIGLITFAYLSPMALPAVLTRHFFLENSIWICALTTLLFVPVGFTFYSIYSIALKRMILWEAKPGDYDVYSFFYVRKWLADKIISATRYTLLPLYTTIYFPPWLRMAGAKVGRRAEVSTLWYFSPDLIEIGAGSFFADGSIIGGKRIHRGRFQIARNKIGERSFVGNSAILPIGKSLGDRCLLGVQSVPPMEFSKTPDGSDWLGSPSFQLPLRQPSLAFSDKETFEPTTSLIIQRLFIDGLRILIPSLIALSSVILGAMGFSAIFRFGGNRALIFLAPILVLGLGWLSAFLVIALKWSIMGRFRPTIKPLWSRYVWWNELVNGAYESIMAPAMAFYLGTPMISLFLRAIGCKIGKYTHIATTLFSEFDLVKIQDHASLNHGAVIQNHLFEDRIFKSSHLSIGEYCSVGNMSVVLYDSEMKPGSRLGPLSLLMKGEILPKGAIAIGIPNSTATLEYEKFLAEPEGEVRKAG